MPTIRPELETPPPQIAALPLDSRGYPIPFFVDYLPNGEPEFRAMDPKKLLRCIREHRCWVCGMVMGIDVTFLVGPMCGINRNTAEPPCHEECAQWSARNCPFLSNPAQVRRDAGIGKGSEKFVDGAGVMIRRNPGATLLWTTRAFEIVRDADKGYLFKIGRPRKVEWFFEGKHATREQVEASVASGLPILLGACPSARVTAEVERRRVDLEKLYP